MFNETYRTLTNYLHALTADKVDSFIDDVYAFIDNHSEYELNPYQDILTANNIALEKESMQNITVSVLG